MWAGRIVCIQTSNDKEVFNDTTYSLYTAFKFGDTIQHSNHVNAHGHGLILLSATAKVVVKTIYD